MKFILDLWPDLDDDDATPENLLAWALDSIARSPELSWTIVADDGTTIAEDVRRKD